MTVELKIEDVTIDESEIDFTELNNKYKNLLDAKIEEEEVLANVLIVDNLPIVDDVREPKLLAVLQKQFNKFGKLKENGIYMPMVDDPKGNGKKVSQGFAFCEFVNAQTANQAIKSIDGHRLDAKHTFTAQKFSDYEKIMETPDSYVPPVEEPYLEKEQLNSWLMDNQARDQFASLVNDETSINWNSARTNEVELVHARSSWTEGDLQFSPQGTYLATIHKQGVAFWGGKSWERLVRFVHANVKLIDFSPSEGYLTTWSPVSNKDDNCRIWDIKTGKLLRAFNVPSEQIYVDDIPENWPVFKYSSSESMVARMNDKNKVEIYDLPKMTLVDVKSVSLENVRNISWRPNFDHLAFWIPEATNIPAKVCVLDVTQRSIIRQKNLFMVSKCRLFWQSAGDYLGVCVDRQTKSKKTSSTNVEVFMMTGKDVPIDVFEGLKDRDFEAFEWEPAGNQFVIVSSEQSKQYVTLCKVEKSVREIETVERKSTESIKWSPNGRFFACCSFGNAGEFDIYDSEEGMQKSITSVSHFQASKFEWDPSGRYFTTVVSYFNTQSENGYTIWNLKGDQVYKKVVPKFKIFIWRPRPNHLLTPEKMKEIRKNLSKYSEKYDEQDKKFQSGLDLRARQHRSTLRNEWLQWREQCQKFIESTKEKRKNLKGNVVEEQQQQQDEDYEEWIEEVIEEKTEVIGQV